MEEAAEAWIRQGRQIAQYSRVLVIVSQAMDGVKRRKRHRPGIAPNDNTTHVPTAGGSAALTKRNLLQPDTPAQKAKILLQMVTPHAA